MKLGVRTILAVLAALGAWSCGSASEAPPLPALSVDNLAPDVQNAVEEAYRKAEAEPESGEASGSLGMVLEAHRLYLPAEQAFQRAVILDPDTFAWRYYLGLTQHDLSKLDEAAETISSALPLRPDYAPALVMLGQMRLEQGRFEESEQALNAALEADPESARALYFLGRVRVAQGDFDGAVDAYRQAVEVFPGYGPAYYGMAIAQQQGDPVGSGQSFIMADRVGPNNEPPPDVLLSDLQAMRAGPVSYLLKAQNAIRREQWPEASQQLDALLQEEPENLDGLLAYLFLGANSDALPVEEARGYFNKAKAIAPGNPDIYMRYGTILMNNQQFDAAVPALEKAIELNPTFAQAHTMLGYIREQRNRPNLAIEEYERALEAKSSHRPARLALGRLLVNQGRYKEAIPRLRRALEVEDSDTTMVMLSLAQAYIKTGNVGRGQEYLRHAQARVKQTGPPELLEGIEGELARTGAIP